MITAGSLIYSGVMPLIKMYIPMLFGFILARKGLFSKDASKGASHVTMSIALPALIFSSIVPAFTPQNVSAIGPLAVLAIIYVVLGGLFGLFIREICYVPRNFWQGIVVMTALSNWGNLPSAIVLSVTTQSPFNPATDPNLGVSFVAIFICIYHIIFWVLGAANSLSWDYKPGVPQGEEAERRLPWNEKPIGKFIAEVLLGYKPSALQTVDEKPGLSVNLHKTQSITPESGVNNVYEESNRLESQTAFVSVASLSSAAATLVVPKSMEPTLAEFPPKQEPHAELPPEKPKFLLSLVLKMSSIVTPITATIAVALPIALIKPLKALFVDTTSTGGPNWKGPDGRPPLYFVLETSSFVGAMAVPLALLLLGVSFARLKVPRPLSRLPIAAMISVSIAKMVVLPAIAIFVIQAMKKRGFISATTKVEVFVAMLLSGSPSAVNQLIVTALYSPTGDAETLSAFLLVQYTLMFIFSAALTAISLHLM